MLAKAVGVGRALDELSVNSRGATGPPTDPMSPVFRYDDRARVVRAGSVRRVDAAATNASYLPRLDADSECAAGARGGTAPVEALECEARVSPKPRQAPSVRARRA